MLYSKTAGETSDLLTLVLVHDKAFLFSSQGIGIVLSENRFTSGDISQNHLGTTDEKKKCPV